MTTDLHFDYNNQEDVLTSLKIMGFINDDSSESSRASVKCSLQSYIDNSTNLKSSLRALIERAVESPNPVSMIRKHINLI